MKENDVGIEFIGRQGFDAVYEKYKNLIFQTAKGQIGFRKKITAPTGRVYLRLPFSALMI